MEEDIQPTPITRQQWAARIIIAALVGIAVTAAAILSAWDQAMEFPVGYDQQVARWELDDIHRDVEAYIDANGSPPPTLGELRGKFGGGMWRRDDGNHLVLDVWQHPYLYERDGNSFVVTSLGRDGKPGGLGLDDDLSSSRPWSPDSFPTFRQFLLEMPTKKVIAACVGSGAMACLLTLLVVRRPRLTLGGLTLLAVKVGATSLAALIAATVMTILHYVPRH